ncbi:MAG: Na+/H+ antiporter NhaA [Thermomicrobiales bacterium]
MALLIAVNLLRVNRPVIYALLGVGLWLALSKSGVHATLAGVLLAMATPARARVISESFIQRGLDRLGISTNRSIWIQAFSSMRTAERPCGTLTASPSGHSRR